MTARDLKDDRLLRRDVTCVATGLLAGGVLGALAAAAFIPVGAAALTVVGAALGAVASWAVAMRISADDWDPPFNRRPYVGANSPDDDDASWA
jgi:hypothetical protein